jgi:hypothetical protein
MPALLRRFENGKERAGQCASQKQIGGKEGEEKAYSISRNRHAEKDSANPAHTGAGPGLGRIDGTRRTPSAPFGINRGGEKKARHPESPLFVG